MAREIIMVFDHQGKVRYWHDRDASTGYVPDSDDLFDEIWAIKDEFMGFAHTHPWNGEAWPSSIDLTTFAAWEQALGRRCVWPVVTFTDVAYVVWEDELNGYIAFNTPPLVIADGETIPHLLEVEGIEELRRRSGSDPSSTA